MVEVFTEYYSVIIIILSNSSHNIHSEDNGPLKIWSATINLWEEHTTTKQEKNAKIQTHLQPVDCIQFYYHYMYLDQNDIDLRVLPSKVVPLLILVMIFVEI